MRGSSWRSARAQLAPANPPPTTTTRGAAPWPSAGIGNTAADAVTVAPSARKRRRDIFTTTPSLLRGEPGGERLDLVVGEALGDPVHDGAGALARAEVLHGAHDRRAVLSGQPRDRRGNLGGGRMTSGARHGPRRRLGGGDHGRCDREEHDRSGHHNPGHGYTIVRPWVLSGNVRMRLPVAAKYALSTAGAATQMVGSPTPPQKPPDGMMIDSTFGICAIFIESYVLKFVCSMAPFFTVHSSMKTAERP